MEKSLIKLAAQLSLICVALWVLGKATGQEEKQRKRKGPEKAQYVPPSRVWFVSPCVAEAICPSSDQPQTALYAG